MNSLSGHVSAKELLVLIKALSQGEASAAERLSNALWNPIQLSVGRMLGDNYLEKDDVAQDSLLAALDYFKRDEGFQGDPVKLAVTIARNRCRDILRRNVRYPQVDLTPMIDWIADPAKSALDDLEQDELLVLLQKALNRISTSCSQLLRSIYIQKTPSDTIRRQLGLKSVQAVYYRRGICLEEAKKLLQQGLIFRSDGNNDQRFGESDALEVSE